MMKALYREKGAEMRVEILNEVEVEDFIGEHAGILDSTFAGKKMSDTMRRSLQESDYVFSGMKTFHELNEAFPSLLDDKGERKPFERFLNDVQKIDSTYNRNYLRSEYNFVEASSTMAGKWEQFEADGDDYYLQYRTAGDSKVRPEHAALDRVTLPQSDDFWDTYYPPNGWNCRCNVVQVLKSSYEQTPHDDAVSRGEQALAKDTRHMFAWNPGKQKKTVPDYNPYTIRDCTNCKRRLSMAKADNPLCQACHILNAGNVLKNKQIETNRMEYERLKSDKNYKEVKFDSSTGGLMATHIGHNFAKEGGGGLAEIIIQKIGYSAGHSVILGDERNSSGKNTEGEWDGRKMEISKRNGTSSNNVKKGLIHCAGKPNCEIAILYFDKGKFDIHVLEKALNRYYGLKDSHSQTDWIAFDKIICIEGEDIVFEKKSPFG